LQVASRDSALRVSPSWMTLDGTDYNASGDAEGVIHLSPVLGGRYVARVSMPIMDSLGMPPVEHEVETRLDARADTLLLPSGRDVVLAACPRDSVRNGEGMLYGRVRDERGQALAGAAVTATWASALVDARTSGQLAYGETTLGSLTSDLGYWRICGVPRGLGLTLHMVSDSGSDAGQVVLDDTHAYRALDFVSHKQIADAANGRALVEIAVNQWGGPPLADVTVEITAAGKTRRVVTGPTGRALVPDVTPGVLTVRARRIGFKQGELAVRVEAGRNTIPILLSNAELPILDTVRVVGNQRLIGMRRNDEFDMRRQLKQSTASFTEEDIKKRNVVDVWQMLTNVPSVRVLASEKVTAQTTRSPNILTPDFHLRTCYMRVMVDGLLMEPMPGDSAVDLRILPKPNEVHGIEVFAGPASIPLQYSGTGSDKWCGLIAIWTK
ncbi:MAG: carboxypeptidase regulatory-like domain-containing protein, partial [Gemmatimonadaceae bacterium]